MPAIVERLGVRLRARGAGPDPGALLGLALRNNPRRAQLLVSRVLGKHVPTDPRVVHAAGLLLGALVADALAGCPPRTLPVDLLHAAVRGAPGAAGALHVEAREAIASDAVDAVVLGFAETATALGHCVAEALGGADYLHSTRRPVAGVATAGSFVEEHSHHTGHLLLPSDPGLLAGPRPLVLVDDELSTGRTAVNTITALHHAAPRAHYVLATLVDLREDALAGLPDGVRVDVVALTRACLTLPPDLAERAAALRAELAGTTVAARPGGDGAAASARVTTPPHAAASARVTTPPHAGHPAVSGAAAPAIACATHAGVDAVGAPAGGADAPARVLLDDLGWPAGLPAGARHGFTAAHHRLLAVALPGLGADLARAAGVRPGERTLVLGTEELMAVPLRLAAALADAGHDVRFSTTTRSPAVVADAPDYALTSGIVFPSHDDPADGPGPRYAYNIARNWDHVLVVVDPAGDTTALRAGLLPGLAPHTRRTTVVVTP